MWYITYKPDSLIVVTFSERAHDPVLAGNITWFGGTKAGCEAEIERLGLLTRVYTTSPRGEHYHRESCQYIQADDNPVEWESVADAEREGFKQCAVCIGGAV